MKRASFLAIAFSAAVALAGVTNIGAAYAAPPCYNTSTPTYDMAGVYSAPALSAAIVVNSCGGVEIVWENDSGRHRALYAAVDRIPGGGFIAHSDVAEGGVFPNGAPMVGIKPAERGYIQLFTADSRSNVTGVYRLTKVR